MNYCTIQNEHNLFVGLLIFRHYMGNAGENSKIKIQQLEGQNNLMMSPVKSVITG